MIEEQKEEEKRAGARNELWQDLWNERSLVDLLLCTVINIFNYFHKIHARVVFAGTLFAHSNFTILVIHNVKQNFKTGCGRH